MNKLALSFASALVTAFFLSAPALAVPPRAALHSGPGRPVIREIMRTFLELELTKEQRGQIKTMIASHQDEILNAAGFALEARMMLFQAVHEENYDEEAIKKAARDSASAQEQLALLRAKIVHEVRSILTGEQKALLAGRRRTMNERIKTAGETVRARFLSWLAEPAI